MTRISLAVASLGALILGAASASAQAPLGTVFTYQGHLQESGHPLDGNTDLLFRLFDVPTGGTALGSQSLPATPVAQGLFTVQLNGGGEFGPNAFNGEERWLEIEVDGTMLAPRQRVTATPYALRALAVQGVDGHSLDAADGSPVDAVYVDAAGSVGVGTLTPTTMLDVNGQITSSGANGGLVRVLNPANAGASMNLSWLNNVPRIRIGGSGAGATNGFDIQRGGDTSLLRILDNGNVGIGVTNPANKLAVSGTISTGSAATAGALTLFPIGGQAWFHMDNPGGRLRISHGSSPGQTQLVNILQNGNVGIGTTTPTAKLEIGGAPGVDGIRFPDGTLQTSADGGSGHWALYGADIHNTNTGNVGIGIATPSAKLEIAGTPGTDGIRFPDGTLQTTALSVPLLLSGVQPAGHIIQGSNSSSGTFSKGVFGVNTAVTGATIGVGGEALSDDGRGVQGNGGRFGVLGIGDEYGVFGGSARNGGVFSTTGLDDVGLAGLATAASDDTTGVYGWTQSPNGWSIYADGLFVATGTKSFVIDHPLDPENKYLQHYCTEAPEPLNAYSGNIVTDRRGYATVELPDYFESINRDFRYQLTVLDDVDSDTFVQAKVAGEIHQNRFVIRTSAPSTKVSWRVEAVRNDAWVRAYGAPVEREKPEGRRGRYLRPELFGQSPEMGIHYRRAPDLPRPPLLPPPRSAADNNTPNRSDE